MARDDTTADGFTATGDAPPPLFVDRAGRVWRPRLTDEGGRLLAEYLIDLAAEAAADGTALFERLYTDDGLMCQVLLVTCREQVRAFGLTNDEFRAAVLGHGPTFKNAAVALAAELARRFPESAGLKRLMTALPSWRARYGWH